MKIEQSNRHFQFNNRVLGVLFLKCAFARCLLAFNMGVIFLLLCHTLLAFLLLLLYLPAGDGANNYYDILKVEPSATAPQIKKSFRTLAVKYHPDKNKSSDAEKAFREIAEAYKVLSNSEKRRQYDSLSHEDFLHQQAEGDDSGQEQHRSTFHFSFTDFYHEFDDEGDRRHSEEEPHFIWSFNVEGEDNSEHDFADFHYTYLSSDQEQEYYSQM